ncbi:MAG: hypothetical protein ACI841_002098 [Planctomycetota bacterium]|jgi:hypothetical protein
MKKQSHRRNQLGFLVMTMVGSLLAVAIRLEPVPISTDMQPSTQLLTALSDEVAPAKLQAASRKTAARVSGTEPEEISTGASIPTSELSGQCVDGDNRPVVTMLELYLQSHHGVLEIVELETDQLGRFKSALEEDTALAAVRVFTNGGWSYEGSLHVDTKSWPTEFPVIRVGSGFELSLECVDQQGVAIDGLEWFMLDRRRANATLGDLQPAERAARALGATDSSGRIRISEMPRGGSYLAFDGAGVMSESRFFTKILSSSSQRVVLERLLPLRGRAPSIEGVDLVQIQSILEAESASVNCAALMRFSNSPNQVLQAVDVLPGGEFELPRRRGHKPLLEARIPGTDELVALAAWDPSTERYEAWVSPEETVLELAWSLPEGSSCDDLAVELEWTLGSARVKHSIRIDPASIDRESPTATLRVPTGRTFVDCQAKVAFTSGAVRSTPSKVMLKPGDVHLQMNVFRPFHVVRVRSLSRETGEVVPAVPLQLLAKDGGSRSNFRTTDSRGEAQFECVYGHTYELREVDGLESQPMILNFSHGTAADDSHFDVLVRSRDGRIKVRIPSADSSSETSGYRLGIASQLRNKVITCLVSVAATPGPSDRARWEEAAYVTGTDEWTMIEALPSGDYYVYARQLTEPRQSFMTLTTSESRSNDGLNALVRVRSGKVTTVELTASQKGIAFLEFDLDHEASPPHYEEVIIETVPCQLIANSIQAANRPLRQATYLGAGRFALTVSDPGPHLVRVVGIGSVPLTEIANLSAGETTVLDHRVSIDVSVKNLTTHAGQAELRVSALALSSSGQAVPSLVPQEAMGLEQPVTANNVLLDGLSPHAQYSIELEIDGKFIRRVLPPLDLTSIEGGVRSRAVVLDAALVLNLGSL